MKEITNNELQEKIKQMTSMSREEFDKWADAGEYSCQDIIDLHCAVLWLHAEVDRLSKK